MKESFAGAGSVFVGSFYIEIQVVKCRLKWTWSVVSWRRQDPIDVLLYTAHLSNNARRTEFVRRDFALWKHNDKHETTNEFRIKLVG